MKKKVPQHEVVVRVDWIVYALVALVMILSCTAIFHPVGIELVGTLCALVTSIIGGWFVFMRGGKSEDE
jgi:hypothetical protein